MDPGISCPRAPRFLPAVTMTSQTLNNSMSPQLAIVCGHSHALCQRLSQHLDDRECNMYNLRRSNLPCERPVLSSAGFEIHTGMVIQRDTCPQLTDLSASPIKQPTM